MSNEELRANDLAQLKGGSALLTALPLEDDENFALNKRAFYDAVSAIQVGIKADTTEMCMRQEIQRRSCHAVYKWWLHS